MSLVLRLAESRDALSVARVHVRSWQAAYRGLLPEEYLTEMRAEERAKKYDLGNRDPFKPQTIVAVERDVVCGFATISAPCGESSSVGDLCALYVDPEYWGGGIGRALIAAARERMFVAGNRNAMLWLLKGNVRAARFYERDGWRPDGASRDATVWGLTVQEIRYRRELQDCMPLQMGAECCSMDPPPATP